MIAPSAKQGRILWFSLTALAIAIFLAVIVLFIWGFGVVLKILTPVLLPLAVAGVLAYLLDPVVDFLERRRIPRVRAILLVFFLAAMIFLGLVATVVPQIIYETRDLITRVPTYTKKLNDKFQGSYVGQRLEFLWKTSDTSTNAAPVVVDTNAVSVAPVPAVENNTEVLQNPLTARILTWTAKILPGIGEWLLIQVQRVGSWIGWLIGFTLVPIYLFYFLKEKSGIQENWRAYVPVRDSQLKDEIVFIVSQINECLIVFFRGQVLVALCTGTLLTIGFLSLGLNYAFLLGAMAGLLGIIPYLGVLVSLIPAVGLATVQFGDWLHPLLVLAIFGLVNLLEGFVISPKIIGDRVGLHPLTIIIAVMVGTTLLGGILGGILAIPLTAALRALMFRYVWKTANKSSE